MTKLTALSLIVLLIVLLPTFGTPAPPEQIMLDGDAYRVEWLARESFDQPAWEKHWATWGNRGGSILTMICLARHWGAAMSSTNRKRRARLLIFRARIGSGR